MLNFFSKCIEDVTRDWSILIGTIFPPNVIKIFDPYKTFVLPSCFHIFFSRPTGPFCTKFRMIKGQKNCKII